MRGATNLTLTGGEPTLNKDLPKFLNYCKQKGIHKIILQTNGTLLSSRSFFKRLIDAFDIDFLVSFHASDRKLYETITGSAKDYGLALKAMDSIHSWKREKLSFGIVICSYNHKHLLEHVRFLHKRYPDMGMFNFIFIDPVNQAKKNMEPLVKMSDSELGVYRALEYIKNNRLKAVVDRMPLCYLRGYEEYSAPSMEIVRNTKSSYLHFDDNMSHDGVRQNNFYEPCSVCTLKKICFGVPENYAEVFSHKEIYPVFDKLGDVIEKINKAIVPD